MFPKQLQQNCIKCHKAYNKQKNTKAAPATCIKCHPKKSSLRTFPKGLKDQVFLASKRLENGSQKQAAFDT
ncbi:MAG: hypothetical protein HKO79_01910 [Desulfobacterales bacterium]|nr:hypothetical protein [Desulfobacterales bacterium]